MKKKEIRQKAEKLEKSLRAAGLRLSKFPIRLADPSMFEIEGVALDRGLLEGVEGGLGRMDDLVGKVEKELNDMEVLLVQLKHARRVASSARKAEKKAARIAKSEAKAQARATKKAEAKAGKKAQTAAVAPAV